jgi:RHH-type transcriptional regulator, proline utilization regulon repressor / proline dehydrogenase / delta 1-pyrroline-5-carboxylate dehydrogenase
MSTQFAAAPAFVVMPTRHLPRSEDSERAAQSLLLAQARRLRVDRHVAAEAQEWTLAARADGRRSLCEAMLDAFGLATLEGKAFMRLAEALLRTPDDATAWGLLCENLRDAEWRPPPTARFKLRVAAALFRWMARVPCTREERLAVVAPLFVWAARLGVARAASQFIVADTIPAALARMRRDPALSLCSIDCLGESARTDAQAQRYFQCYENAIDELARQPSASIHARHSISIKLSALDPRFGPRHRGSYAAGLIPKVTQLARRASAADIGLTIDAEEQDRLESTLDVMAALIDDPATRRWDGLGLAVQAYGLRASQVIAWLAARARQHHRRMTVRLVKGAYWDSEIKRAQERGLNAFPVFTDKCATDASYLLCAKYLFDQRDVIFPQFATHNAMTVATVLAIAPPDAAFEFQRLHGMGEQLYRAASRVDTFPLVRVYAPVGSREDLLAYLIRRLLENGANSSFVRHFLDPAIPVAALLENPIEALGERLQKRAAASVGLRDEARS